MKFTFLATFFFLAASQVSAAATALDIVSDAKLSFKNPCNAGICRGSITLNGKSYNATMSQSLAALIGSHPSYPNVTYLIADGKTPNTIIIRGYFKDQNQLVID